MSTREIDVHGTLAHVCGEDLAEAVRRAGQHARWLRRCSAMSSASTTWSRSGLRPLAERKARGKIVVDVAGSA